MAKVRQVNIAGLRSIKDAALRLRITYLLSRSCTRAIMAAKLRGTNEQALRPIVRYLMTKSCNEIPYAVDFIVDRFDRGDDYTLGVYWNGLNGKLKNGFAVNATRNYVIENLAIGQVTTRATVGPRFGSPENGALYFKIEPLNGAATGPSDQWPFTWSIRKNGQAQPVGARIARSTGSGRQYYFHPLNHKKERGFKVKMKYRLPTDNSLIGVSFLGINDMHCYCLSVRDKRESIVAEVEGRVERTDGTGIPAQTLHRNLIGIEVVPDGNYSYLKAEESEPIYNNFYDNMDIKVGDKAYSHTFDVTPEFTDFVHTRSGYSIINNFFGDNTTYAKGQYDPRLNPFDYSRDFHADDYQTVIGVSSHSFVAWSPAREWAYFDGAEASPFPDGEAMVIRDPNSFYGFPFVEMSNGTQYYWRAEHGYFGDHWIAHRDNLEGWQQAMRTDFRSADVETDPLSHRLRFYDTNNAYIGVMTHPSGIQFEMQEPEFIEFVRYEYDGHVRATRDGGPYVSRDYFDMYMAVIARKEVVNFTLPSKAIEVYISYEATINYNSVDREEYSVGGDYLYLNPRQASFGVIELENTLEMHYKHEDYYGQHRYKVDIVINGNKYTNITRAWSNDEPSIKNRNLAWWQNSSVGFDLTKIMLPVDEIVGDYGVSLFKVWVDDIPEPSDDESGHGVAVDNDGVTSLNYMDAYHAGGTYEPTANDNTSRYYYNLASNEKFLIEPDGELIPKGKILK